METFEIEHPCQRNNIISIEADVKLHKLILSWFGGKFAHEFYGQRLLVRSREAKRLSISTIPAARHGFFRIFSSFPMFYTVMRTSV